MKRSIFLFLLSFVAVYAFAQTPNDKRQLRVVDTLTSQERLTRIPVITRMEADSMIQAYIVAHPAPEVAPEKQLVSEVPFYWLAGIVAALLILIIVAYLVFMQQKQIRHENHGLASSLRRLHEATAEQWKPEKISSKPVGKHNESKVKEEQSLKKDLESLKALISGNYKVKNYAGVTAGQSEMQSIQSLFTTEGTVALYAFENFLKPINAIADANKNNPAKISEEEADRIISLLLSLSFLYIEYLYLRVNDLSIGGHIAERIASLRGNSGINGQQLKPLNKEHGSRPLVIKIALQKKNVTQLTYPVFEETDLNN